MLFRGTQHPDIKGFHKSPSYTSSLPAAIIWSSRPPDVWSNRKAAFLQTSTVYRATLNSERILDLARGNNASFADILKALRYETPDGISQDEALKILQYMHNRIIGKAKGGEFLYVVWGEDGEPSDEGGLPFSLHDPVTLISEFKDEFRDEGSLELAERLQADVFIFGDAPAVQRAAVKLGYDVLRYLDVFAGAEGVSEELLGIPADELQGINMERDLNGERVPTHETYRPLTKNAIEIVDSIPTKGLLKEVSQAELRASS